MGARGQGDRRKRWDRWYPSLLDEIGLVAKPGAKILTLGGKATSFLRDTGFKKLDGTVLHFSAQAVRWRKEVVKGKEAEFEHFADSMTIGDVVAVADKATAEAGISERLRQRILNRLRVRVLSLSSKQLIFAYKVSFDAMNGSSTNIVT